MTILFFISVSYHKINKLCRIHFFDNGNFYSYLKKKKKQNRGFEIFKSC